MNILLVFLLFLPIQFKWDPTPPTAPKVESFKVCVGTTPGTCTVTASVNSPNTDLILDLDISKIWFAVVTGINKFGISDASNQVVVGKPLLVTGFDAAPAN